MRVNVHEALRGDAVKSGEGERRWFMWRTQKQPTPHVWPRVVHRTPTRCFSTQTSKRSISL
jgi:hypothetical protein